MIEWHRTGPNTHRAVVSQPGNWKTWFPDYFGLPRAKGDSPYDYPLVSVYRDGWSGPYVMEPTSHPEMNGYGLYWKPA
jgi:hypothetical protein